MSGGSAIFSLAVDEPLKFLTCTVVKLILLRGPTICNTFTEFYALMEGFRLGIEATVSQHCT